MTDSQKILIKRLRSSGSSYKSIATDLGLPEGTIKTCCRRHGLQHSVNSNTKKNSEKCEYCGKPIVQVDKRKPKRFCSDACRRKWWNTHRDIVNRKGVHKMLCAACGKNFESYDVGRKFCSHACYIKYYYGSDHNDARAV